MINKYIFFKNKILILLIFIIFSFVIFSVPNVVQAAHYDQDYANNVNNINDSLYPEYKTLLQTLQRKYPYWKFKLYYTGLDWAEAVTNQCQGHGTSPKSLFPYGDIYKGEWYCQICGYSTFGSGWYCASEAAISYMLDPRNSINESDIFQFQDISNDTTITKDHINQMAYGSFIYNNQSIIDAIYNVAQSKNIHPFYITGKILQEQGMDGSTLSTGMYHTDGNYYYNLFNVGATGSTDAEIISTGFSYAVSKGWTTPELSIAGGVNLISSSYVPKGQSTPYFQKFNVVNPNGLYRNQYAQNIMDAQSQGTRLRSAYSKIGKLSEAYTFIIPIYENMPKSACSRPSYTTGFYAKTFNIARINVSSELALRAKPGGSEVISSGGNKVYVNGGNTVKVVAEATTPDSNGVYWDKVSVTSGGYIGYYGYMSRGPADGSKQYLVVESYGEDTGKYDPNNSIITQVACQEFELDDGAGKLIAEPNVTIESIREKYPTAIADTTKIGTGTTVTIDGKQYITVKLGDVNGDCVINSGDLLRIQKHLLELISLTDTLNGSAADINYDTVINSGDLLKMQKYLLEVGTIELK